MQLAPNTPLREPARSLCRLRKHVHGLQARRRGAGLMTALLVLLVAAFVMDGLATRLERERSDATAAAMARQIRMIAEMASVTGVDPVAGGLLPHIAVRRELAFEFRAVADGDDEVAFSWPDLPAASAAALGNRLGEWLGSDRVTSPLVLALTDVPNARAELVRRRAPDVHADIAATEVRGAGGVVAASGRFDSARVGSIARFGWVAVEDATIEGTVTGRTSRVEEDIGTANNPVMLTVSAPLEAQQDQASGAVQVDVFSASLTLAADNLVGERARADSDLDARVLVPQSADMIDLARASIDDVTASSVRVHGTVHGGHVTVVEECVGCLP